VTDPDPRDELTRLTRSVRSLVEVQGILRDGAPVVPKNERAAPARAVAPVRVMRSAPAPAARVTTARPATPPPAAVVVHPWQRDPATSDSLGALHDTYAACHRCPLGESRTHFVFGVGNPEATVMFIGEAPGRDEDLQGEPFVGRAGQLHTKILSAIQFTREDVYIANILKCRPPGNRNPEPSEIASCEPILRPQIELIRPVILCTLGSFAARTLLGVTTGITRLRGQMHDYRGIPVVPTYHPAALLRNPEWKRPTWEDVQLLRKEHDRLVAQTRSSP
jgi:DNA polymerase